MATLHGGEGWLRSTPYLLKVSARTPILVKVVACHP
jgi:hypothetical protein